MSVYGVINESCHSFAIDTVKIKLDKVVSCRVMMDDDYKTANDEEKAKLDSMLKAIPSIVKLIEGTELWGHLYKLQKDYYDDINDDPYFEGRKVKSGKDLKNSIDTKYKVEIYIDAYRNCVYFCGDYWCDPEHGFAVTFPDGKFIKKKDGKPKENKYFPYYTYLGSYDEAL